jgi:hypothetical protein
MRTSENFVCGGQILVARESLGWRNSNLFCRPPLVLIKDVRICQWRVLLSPLTPFRVDNPVIPGRSFWVSLLNIYLFFLFCGTRAPQWARAASYTRYLDHTQRPSRVSRTPLDELSARRRDLYLTTHNPHNNHPCPRWDSDPPSQQPSSRSPTQSLDRAASGIGLLCS